MSRALDDLIPKLKEICQAFLQECNEAEIPMLVVCTYRSFEEQEALYAKGRVRPGPVVTNARAGDSFHNFRRAFDVAFLKGTQLTWNGPWEKVGKIGGEPGPRMGRSMEKVP